MFMRPTQYAPQFTYNPGLGEEVTAPVSWLDKLTSTVQQLAPTVAQYKLTKLNYDRVKAGLPPLDTSAVAPTVRVQAEVDPQIKRALFIGGGILAGAAVLAALRK